MQNTVKSKTTATWRFGDGSTFENVQGPKTVQLYQFSHFSEKDNGSPQIQYVAYHLH